MANKNIYETFEIPTGVIAQSNPFVLFHYIRAKRNKLYLESIIRQYYDENNEGDDMDAIQFLIENKYILPKRTVVKYDPEVI